MKLTVTEAKHNIWNPLRETWGLTEYLILASKLTDLSLLHILQTRIKAELENHLNIVGFISDNFNLLSAGQCFPV